MFQLAFQLAFQYAFHFLISHHCNYCNYRVLQRLSAFQLAFHLAFQSAFHALFSRCEDLTLLQALRGVYLPSIEAIPIASLSSVASSRILLCGGLICHPCRGLLCGLRSMRGRPYRAIPLAPRRHAVLSIPRSQNTCGQRGCSVYSSGLLRYSLTISTNSSRLWNIL